MSIDLLRRKDLLHRTPATSPAAQPTLMYFAEHSFPQKQLSPTKVYCERICTLHNIFAHKLCLSPLVVAVWCVCVYGFGCLVEWWNIWAVYSMWEDGWRLMLVVWFCDFTFFKLNFCKRCLLQPTLATLAICTFASEISYVLRSERGVAAHRFDMPTMRHVLRVQERRFGKGFCDDVMTKSWPYFGNTER